MRFLIYQESEIGGRRQNEDRLGYLYTRDALMLMVADGMGGHAQGEVAAEIAVSTLSKRFRDQAKPRLKAPLEFLRDSFYAIHELIVEYAERAKLAESPRTTCVACIVQQDHAYWAHTGDSRLYLLRGARLIAQTRDHSHVQRLVDAGLIEPSEAQGHPARNRIYSCLGGIVLPQISLSEETVVNPGDTLVLSSDGFWDPLPVAEIQSALARKALTDAIPELLAAALARGGEQADNASVVAMTWDPHIAAGAISTAEMGEDQLTTEMHSHFPSGTEDLRDISDAEIDQAVAEIQSAIRKKRT